MQRFGADGVEELWRTHFVDVPVEGDGEAGEGEGVGEFWAEAVDDGPFEGGLAGRQNRGLQEGGKWAQNDLCRVVMDGPCPRAEARTKRSGST